MVTWRLLTTVSFLVVKLGAIFSACSALRGGALFSLIILDIFGIIQ